MTAAAEFAAAHALLLLAAATLLCTFAALAILGLVHLAVRHADRLWTLIDAFIPGDIWRPRTYLLGHLVLGFVLIAALLGFLAIASDVSAQGAIAEFDVAFAAALRSEIDPTWRSAFWVFTWFGTYWPITAAVAAGAWRLLSRGRRLLALMWWLSQAGGFVISEGLKATFVRPRPPGADRALFGDSWSFPSGHALCTLVLCGVGAYILLRTIRSWRDRVILISAALAWTLAMGFSRIYLGVHYVSDVTAGFLIGTAWVAICVSGMEVASRRGDRAGRDADERVDRVGT